MFVLILAIFALLAISLAGAQETTQATGVLAAVLERGVLNCGVSGGLPGFSIANPDTGRMEGLDADFCRVVALAVFGPAYTEESVNFVPLTADVRFTALANGEVDVLMRNTTWTLTRDISLGLDFGPTTFYDGQGLLVRVADGYTTLADMEGASFCSTSGTTTEKNITDAYRAVFGADPTLVLAPGPQENLADFEAGRCDVLTSDKSQLAGLRSASTDPSALAILPDTLSKEPLGPVYVSNDSQWAAIVDWAVYATLQAEEFGLTSATIADAASSTDPGIQRFVGATEDNFGGLLGIPNSFAVDIITNVGNYAEIYERNIVPIGIPREGSANALWTTGGLLYSPAWR